MHAHTDELCPEIVRYVARTLHHVVNDAAVPHPVYRRDPYAGRCWLDDAWVIRRRARQRVDTMLGGALSKS